MGSLVSADPFRCILWESHDRLEEHITLATCRDLIDSFETSGQATPTLGRALSNDAEFDIEIICGARRLFAARHLRMKLLVEVRQLTDREAVIAMEAENRDRKDTCPYERGRSFAAHLRAGLFKSQEEMAHAIAVSAAHVSRMLRIASLPSVIVAAFPMATDIRENWGLRLAALMSDSAAKCRIIQAARDIAQLVPRPPAREVYGTLLASAVSGRRLTPKRRDKVVTGQDGTPLFRVKYQRGAVAVVLPMERTSAKTLSAIEGAIQQIVESRARTVPHEGATADQTSLQGSPRGAESQVVATLDID